jgi:anti-sigma regulatory factor (Ser/Thr protein kinase)
MDAFEVHTDHRFGARSDAIGEARRAALAYAREHAVPADRLDAIALAVSEAATNVVVHAYRDPRQPGTFTLGLDRNDDSLTIDVRDDGLGMAERYDSPGLGLALKIIANVTDAYAFVPTGEGGTCLSMRFDLAA